MPEEFKSAVLLCLLARLAIAAPAQTPQKVIEEYLQAQGGAKALARIQTQTIAGNLTEEASGKTGSWSLIARSPDRLYTEIIAGPSRAVEAYNGMSAWGQDSPEGPRTLTGNAAKQTEATAQYWNARFGDLKQSRESMQMLGTEQVHGNPAYHIQAVLGSRLTRELFFDVRTHLIAREILPTGIFDYDDYRPVQGIQTPYPIELHRGGQNYKISVTRVEFNASIDDAVFNFPHFSATPLPDIATLIGEVIKNQKAVDEMQKQYTCHLTEEQATADSKGRVTSVAIREYEVFNIAGQEVRRLLSKDGKPLTGNARKKEDDRFNKEFEKLTKAEAARDPGKQQKQEEKEEAQISNFLRAVRFNNARRERFRGEDVIAVDFGPNPDYKPRKAIENVVRQLAGVMWIDEKARDVARLEAHFSNNVKIGGGLLASVDKGSAFVFEQAKVNNEVWLPTYDEIHVAGRFLVLKVKANQIDRYSDYKKFHAESTFLPDPQ